MKTKNKILLTILFIALCFSCEGNQYPTFERTDTLETFEFAIPGIFHGTWIGSNGTMYEITEKDILTGGVASDYESITQSADAVSVIQKFDGTTYYYSVYIEDSTGINKIITISLKPFEDGIMLIGERKQNGIIDSQKEWQLLPYTPKNFLQDAKSIISFV